jgi:hypothetical protein
VTETQQATAEMARMSTELSSLVAAFRFWPASGRDLAHARRPARRNGFDASSITAVVVFGLSLLRPARPAAMTTR